MESARFHPTTPHKKLANPANQHSADSKQKIILVLDDFHLISNPQIHKDLAYLIENHPSSLHIVLLTRADPPLLIPRLRGRGMLTEIRAAYLRFTIEETEIFLNRMMRLGLSNDELCVLGQQTEGWIIGLQLAAIRCKVDLINSISFLIFGGDIISFWNI